MKLGTFHFLCSCSLIGLLLLHVSAASSEPNYDEPLRGATTSVRVHTFGTASSLLSGLAHDEMVPLHTRPDGTIRPTLMESFRMAFITTTFPGRVSSFVHKADEGSSSPNKKTSPMFVRGNMTECSTATQERDCIDALSGIGRLLCGYRLIESHRSPIGGQIVPRHAMAWPFTDLPVVRLFYKSLFGRDPEENEYTLAIVLRYTAGNEVDRKLVENMSEDELRKCSLMFLPPEAQTWTPQKPLVDSQNMIISGRLSLSNTSRPQPTSCSSLTPLSPVRENSNRSVANERAIESILRSSVVSIAEYCKFVLCLVLLFVLL